MKVSYDEETDVLYLAKEGQEGEVVEVYPGVNLEFGRKRELLGIEILGASRILKGVADPLREKAARS
ncbi:MAG: DUF2283 domain-containing protein [Chloroflexi bacterium]|nr:DUF2283 domain-containing protein [Chloroflexota bacterium]